MSNLDLKQDSETVHKAEEAGNRKFPDSLFTDAGWRPFGFQVAKRIGAYPNRLYFNPDAKLGVTVAFRSASGSWALNEPSVNYVRDAVRSGRIVGGYAILATNNPPKVVSSMEIEAVAKLLEGVQAREGNFGRYWWVYEQFATDESPSLAEAFF
jgi:hypothetical protein